jgi:hypothetical protein
MFINFWIRHGFLNSVNRAAKQFGVPGYTSIFDFWRGDITLAAEFSSLKLPFNHFFIGPGSAERVSDARRDQDNSEGQAADLLRHGKLRHP